MPKHGYVSLTLRREVAEALRMKAKALRMGVNDFLELLLCWDCTATPATRVQIPAAAPKQAKNSPFQDGPGTVPRQSFEAVALSVGDWAEAYRIAARILTGEPQTAVVWDGTVREKFVEWMKANGRSWGYIYDCVAYLNKYVSKIVDPEDIINIFNRCERGKHHLERSLRALLNYYEAVEGGDREYLDKLRKAIPNVKIGVDLREVNEEQILETFRILRGLPQNHKKYFTLWSVILDSGIRLFHAVHFMRTFDPSRLITFNNFSRYPLAVERETKHTWYVYMRPQTAALLQKMEVTKSGVFRFLSHLREKGLSAVNPKLVRKFAYNQMIRLGIPESVADFLNGRAPKTIGATHYLWLVQQADQYYPRYASYLDSLLSRL